MFYDLAQSRIEVKELITSFRGTYVRPLDNYFFARFIFE